MAHPLGLPFSTVRWSPKGAVRIIDQRMLPGEFVERDLLTIADVAHCIRVLAVRGAPAIGVTAAMGLAAATDHAMHTEPTRAEGWSSREMMLAQLREDADTLRATRPTAVNLAWALDRMLARAERVKGDGTALVEALREEAEAIRTEDVAMCAAIGEHGVGLLRQGIRVLTHCNAGSLATAGIGTALAPIYLAHKRGMALRVYADETRPLLQGARLTAWELSRAGVPVTVLADGMAASLMAEGRVDLVLVGADRIAANGDVANKIGTYGLAVLAHHHKVPFVVCAPWTTVDLATPSGDKIPIEQRSGEELAQLADTRLIPEGVAIHNPAFDITPAGLISKIVTDRGILYPPFHFEVSSVELPPPA